MATAIDQLQSRAARISELRVRIEHDTEELNKVHEQLFSSGLPHAEWLRLADVRNNLLAAINQKEAELSWLTDTRKTEKERSVYKY